MNVLLLDEYANKPIRSSSEAAGYDICCIEHGCIDPGDRLLVRTGLAIQVPIGTYGRIAPRSGLAVKHGIHVGAGVIDRDYRGEIRVLLCNLGNERFEFKRGDRIAQLILEKIETPEVFVVETLDETSRGSGGFGSTGV